MDFYDKLGNVIAYSDDGEIIYLYSGRAVAYIAGEAIHTFSGDHIGWLESGWVRDLQGKCVSFTENATGGLATPAKKAKHAKSAKNALVARGARKALYAKVAHFNSWSEVDAVDFFN